MGSIAFIDASDIVDLTIALMLFSFRNLKSRKSALFTHPMLTLLFSHLMNEQDHRELSLITSTVHEHESHPHTRTVTHCTCTTADGNVVGDIKIDNMSKSTKHVLYSADSVLKLC